MKNDLLTEDLDNVLQECLNMIDDEMKLRLVENYLEWIIFLPLEFRKIFSLSLHQMKLSKTKIS